MSNETVTPQNLKELAPRKENTVTAVLNGIGNATMIVGVPFIVKQVLDDPKGNRGLLVASIAAVVVGAIWGWKEAGKVTKYRGALMEEINRLRYDVNVLKSENISWKQRLSEQEIQIAGIAPKL